MKIKITCGLMLLLILIFSVNEIAAQEGPGIVIAHPGQDVELLCNVTGGVATWRVINTVNNTLYTLSDFFNGGLAGHNSTGNNIIVEDIMMNDDRNGSVYICVIPQNEKSSDPTILYVAGVPAMVPNVTVDNNTININGNNVTLTLSWGESFNNLDPIVNYTVSCSGNVTCPPNFTTTDNTTRSYTITNFTPMTDYTFSVVATNSIGSGEAGAVMITTPDVPAMVPDVTVDDNTISINGNNVTLTLSWGEPFNNLDPIVSYTVSCSGDVTCPPNFTTTDNTTRNYTITNLTPMTNYTFSVVATNSFGSGEAGVVMITTPAISQVTGVLLTCEPMGLINQCTVTWESVTQGDVIGYQVYYNGIMRNVNSSTTTLTFTAPSLPDGVFTGTVVFMVTAINQYGVGPVSNSSSVEITSTSVTKIRFSFSAPRNTSGQNVYSITVICIIHPDSTADQCVVMAMADGRVTRTNSASVVDEMAMVTVNELECGVNYTIIAEGTLNTNLVGPRSSFLIGINVCDTSGPSALTDDDGNTGAIVGGVVGGTVGGLGGVAGIVVFVIWYRKRKRSSSQDIVTGGMPLTSPKVKPSETDSAAFKEEAKEVNEGPTDMYAQVHKPSKEQQPKQTNEGPTDEYAQVHKPSKEQQPKQTEGGINYADLDIQRGPKQFGSCDHAVAYGQVTETTY